MLSPSPIQGGENIGFVDEFNKAIENWGADALFWAFAIFVVVTLLLYLATKGRSHLPLGIGAGCGFGALLYQLIAGPWPVWF